MSFYIYLCFFLVKFFFGSGNFSVEGLIQLGSQYMHIARSSLLRYMGLWLFNYLMDLYIELIDVQFKLACHVEP
jgi:hypothetical protein